jgi:hypothetical protein
VVDTSALSWKLSGVAHNPDHWTESVGTIQSLEREFFSKEQRILKDLIRNGNMSHS